MSSNVDDDDNNNNSRVNLNDNNNYEDDNDDDDNDYDDKAVAAAEAEAEFESLLQGDFPDEIFLDEIPFDLAFHPTSDVAMVGTVTGNIEW